MDAPFETANLGPQWSTIFAYTAPRQGTSYLISQPGAKLPWALVPPRMLVPRGLRQRGFHGLRPARLLGLSGHSRWRLQNRPLALRGLFTRFAIIGAADWFLCLRRGRRVGFDFAPSNLSSLARLSWWHSGKIAGKWRSRKIWPPWIYLLVG